MPGISNKIHAPQERDLVLVKKYWNAIIPNNRITDIYSGEEINSNGISVDHFIPWSYVTHDELWNLTPTTRSINSSKSSSLPDYDLYFSQLANQEYEIHKITVGNEQIRKEFEKCRKKHISDLSVLSRMYRSDISKEEFRFLLNELVQPVYLAAEKQGFGQWRYNENT